MSRGLKRPFTGDRLLWVQPSRQLPMSRGLKRQIVLMPARHHQPVKATPDE